MNLGYLVTRWVLACDCDPGYNHCAQCDVRRKRRALWRARRDLREARERLAALRELEEAR